MVDNNINIQMTRDEVGSESTIKNINKQFSENMNVIQGPTQTKTRDVGTDAIWGLFNWAAKDWDGDYGSLFILSSPTLGVLGTNRLGANTGEYTVQSVTNPNNTYYDYFDTATYEDTTVSTATWGSTGSITFTEGQIAQSIECYKGLLDVYAATITVTNVSGIFVYYLSSDGGTNWESVTHGTKHTFTNAGKDLRYKIVQNDGIAFPTQFGTWGALGGSGEISLVTIKYEVN